MVYTRTPKLKLALRHAGRVRQIREKKVRVTQQQRRLQQIRKESIETHFQEQLANDNLLDNVVQDASYNEAVLTDFWDNESNISTNEAVSTDFWDNKSNISTNEAVSTDNTDLEDNESNISTDFQDILANDDISEQDNHNFFQDNDQNANNFSQKIADEPAFFESFNGEYGPYFANFTEQMLFLWIIKHMICK